MIKNIIYEHLKDIETTLCEDINEPAGRGCGFGFSESSLIYAESKFIECIFKIIKEVDEETLNKIRKGEI